MLLFYTDQIQLEQQLAFFDKEESRHIVQSLRMKIGDTLHFTNGQGNEFTGAILSADKRKVIVKIDAIVSHEATHPALHLSVSPIKQHERLEWLVEKSVELGVQTISFPVCQRTERNKIRIDRLKRIAISAMKQSLQFHLPQFIMGVSLADILKGEAAQKLIGYISEEPPPFISVVLQPRQNSLILIGPEGDFTEEEIEQAMVSGFQKISLGQNRLRTETAAVYATSVFKTINQL